MGWKPAQNAAKPTSSHDGIDRRNFLSCMAWAGAGLVWTMAGGVPTSRIFAAAGDRPARQRCSADFSFVQISDSHIGFNKAANQNVTGTLKMAIAKINALPGKHDLLLHTGDITHSSKAAEFDTAQQIVNGAKAGAIFYVPGEHDTASDDGALYLERFGKGTKGTGWYSFTHKGVHFVGLNNSQQIDKMGMLGADQLAWLKNDLGPLSASTPIVVFAHIPLWMVYPDWGWGTQDGAQALSYLKRFGSVTVAERTHPSGRAEGGRQRLIPHRDLNRIPPARAGQGPERGTDGRPRRRTPKRPRRHRGQIRPEARPFGGGRFFVGLRWIGSHMKKLILSIAACSLAGIGSLSLARVHPFGNAGLFAGRPVQSPLMENSSRAALAEVRLRSSRRSARTVTPCRSERHHSMADSRPFPGCWNGTSSPAVSTWTSSAGKATR